ncbi:MAG: hypothetical protein GX488_11715 [Clostridiales bacterium]|nr:hypothetical protein [Clostridiales bacterium]
MSKYENWRELVSECKASGKPAKTWCQEHNIPYYTYRGWLRRPEVETVDAQKLFWYSKIATPLSNVV